MIRRERKAFSEASSVAEQVLYGVQTVLAFNSQDFEFKRYGKHLDEGSKTGFHRAMVMAVFFGLYKLALFGSMGLSFW
jgi:ATP-binding cassette subfamily B (MDR/TAP) protein 1